MRGSGTLPPCRRGNRCRCRRNAEESPLNGAPGAPRLLSAQGGPGIADPVPAERRRPFGDIAWASQGVSTDGVRRQLAPIRRAHEESAKDTAALGMAAD